MLIISNNGRTNPSPGAGPAFVSAYISPPWEPSLVGPALAMAWQNHHRLRRLEGRVAELDQALDSRKNIERAKGVFMEQRGLSLDQAEQRPWKARPGGGGWIWIRWLGTWWPPRQVYGQIRSSN